MSEQKSLSTLVVEMAQIEAQIVEAEGEITPAIEAMLASVQTDLAFKVDGYAFFMDKLKINAGYWKDQAEISYRVSKSLLNVEERLKGGIKFAMQALNTDEVKGVDVRFKLSKSKPRLLLEETMLPAEYKMVVTEMVPDKEKIHHDLGVGIEIPGAKLEESFSLRKYPNKKG